VSSESSCALRLARHSQNAWARHVECVESSRVESSQVEFEPMLAYDCWPVSLPRMELGIGRLSLPHFLTETTNSG